MAADPTLRAALAREGGAWGVDEVSRFGRTITSAKVGEWAAAANLYPPVLHTHDRYGERRDEVEFHPAWHELMRTSIADGLHSLPFEHAPGGGGRVVRDAKFMLMAQIEAGHGCPLSMTSAAHYTLSRYSERSDFIKLLNSRNYDPRFVPFDQKSGALVGMGMTERQGGSDVRANETTAQQSEDGYRLSGHKWFMSAPMCDAFLVLAKAPGGISCFLMPRFTPDGTRNRIHLQRLKNKLGNHSNASSEVEFDSAWAELVGEEGRGVSTIIEMVNGTRLDCVVGSVGLMRQAVTQAGWHAAHRSAFGGFLIDKPLMQNVLADLELEVEAATMLMMRLSGAFDRADSDPGEMSFKRLATPLIKYWVTKRCSEVVREAMECLGGNGYVEESGLPRLYRESPLNAIWEGSGNVIALDLLRAVSRDRDSVESFLTECDVPGLERHVVAARNLVETTGESGARRLAALLAKVLAGSLLVRNADENTAKMYLETRLDAGGQELFGALPPRSGITELAQRTVPR